MCAYLELLVLSLELERVVQRIIMACVSKYKHVLDVPSTTNNLIDKHTKRTTNNNKYDGTCIYLMHARVCVCLVYVCNKYVRIAYVIGICVLVASNNNT